MAKKPKPSAQVGTPQGTFFAVAPSAATKPTPNQVLNYVINALAYCSGFSASSITKDWVLGDPTTDSNGDRHPGAGLSQTGIDTCFTTKLNQMIVHVGSSNTIPAGTYSGNTKVSEVADDISQRV